MSLPHSQEIKNRPRLEKGQRTTEDGLNIVYRYPSIPMDLR